MLAELSQIDRLKWLPWRPNVCSGPVLQHNNKCKQETSFGRPPLGPVLQRVRCQRSCLQTGRRVGWSPALRSVCEQDWGTIWAPRGPRSPPSSPHPGETLTWPAPGTSYNPAHHRSEDAQETTWRRGWGGLLSSGERCTSFF